MVLPDPNLGVASCQEEEMGPIVDDDFPCTVSFRRILDLWLCFQWYMRGTSFQRPCGKIATYCYTSK